MTANSSRLAFKLHINSQTRGHAMFICSPIYCMQNEDFSQYNLETDILVEFLQ